MFRNFMSSGFGMKVYGRLGIPQHSVRDLDLNEAFLGLQWEDLGHG